jgi:hypothetical protein
LFSFHCLFIPQIKSLGITALGNFSVHSLSASQVNFILEQEQIVINNCLSNCSNQGSCRFMNTSLTCACFEYFTGSSCNVDTRPCSSSPCASNSQCIQNLTDLTFYCNCSQYYEGVFCENKIDICQNETCSGNGYCVDVDHVPTCMCAYLYEGAHCEKQSKTFVAIKQAISVTTIIAIIFICGFYLVVLIMDLPKVCHYLRFRDHVYRRDLVRPGWRNKLYGTNRNKYFRWKF